MVGTAGPTGPRVRVFRAATWRPAPRSWLARRAGGRRASGRALRRLGGLRPQHDADDAEHRAEREVGDPDGLGEVHGDHPHQQDHDEDEGHDGHEHPEGAVDHHASAGDGRPGGLVAHRPDGLHDEVGGRSGHEGGAAGGTAEGATGARRADRHGGQHRSTAVRSRPARPRPSSVASVVDGEADAAGADVGGEAPVPAGSDFVAGRWNVATTTGVDRRWPTPS